MVKSLIKTSLLAGLLLGASSCRHRFVSMQELRQQTIFEPRKADSPKRDTILMNSPSLTKLLASAALNNPGLKAAYLKWQAQLLKVYPAGTLPDPTVSFTYFIQSVETRVGAQEEAIAIMQKFPWFGKLDLREAMQEEKAKVAQAIYQALKVKLFNQVEQIYYDFYYLEKSLLIAEENKRLLMSFEPIARNLIKTGKSVKDLLKVQVELGRIEDRISGLKLRQIPLKARMNELLNRSAQSPLMIVVDLPSRMGNLDEEKLHRLLIDQNAELNIFNFRLSAAENKILLARKDFYPDFSLGVNYVRTSDADYSTPDNGKDPIMATIGLTLPLNQRKYSHLEQSSVKEFGSIRMQRLQKQRQLERRLKVALYEMEDNERIYKLYENTLIPKNTQALKITLQAYRNGKADFLELIDIQRQVLEFELMQEKALTSLYKQEAILRELSNQSLIIQHKKGSN